MGCTFRKVLALGIAAFLSAPAMAAEQGQPYAGQQHRTIKAMSADAIQGHLDGRGLGYAKAAELNQYPGPLHVRELEDQLSLTPQQRDSIRRIEAAMKADARLLGALVVEKERALDALFAGRSATPDAVKAATVEIGQLKGALRAAHLNAHVAVRPLLSEKQVAAYDTLRGYGGGTHGAHSSHKHGH